MTWPAQIVSRTNSKPRIGSHAAAHVAGRHTIRSLSSEALMIVQCCSCGQTWPRDPILEVACPTCRAPLGRRCKRPGGHDASDDHVARDLLAMNRVPGYG